MLAHRGGIGPWRENTLEAMAGARAAGADGVELDVHRCRDGTLAVHHDPAVEGRELHTMTRSDLPAWMPTLAAALEACRDLTVNIEVKNRPSDPGCTTLPGELVDTLTAVMGAGRHRAG